jgi:hypothetical protein
MQRNMSLWGYLKAEWRKAYAEAEAKHQPTQAGLTPSGMGFRGELFTKVIRKEDKEHERQTSSNS